MFVSLSVSLSLPLISPLWSRRKKNDFLTTWGQKSESRSGVFWLLIESLGFLVKDIWGVHHSGLIAHWVRLDRFKGNTHAWFWVLDLRWFHCTGLVLAFKHQAGKHHSVVIFIVSLFAIFERGDIMCLCWTHTEQLNYILHGACVVLGYIFIDQIPSSVFIFSLCRVDLWNNENLAQDVFLGETRVPVKVLRDDHIHKAW